MIPNTPELDALSRGAECGAMLAKASWKGFWLSSGGSLDEPNSTTIRTGLLRYFDEKVAPTLPAGEPLPGSKARFLELFRKACADSFMVHLREHFEQHRAELAKKAARKP